MFVKRKRDVDTEADRPVFTEEQIKTYDELTIKVLGILESQGVNIYDENNKPGMYLRNKHTSVQNIFKSLDAMEEAKNENEQASTTQGPDNTHLINFFSKK